MKLRNILIPVLLPLLSIGCSRNPKLEISLPSKFEGQKVEIVNFLDSTVMASATVENGVVRLERPDSTAVFASIVIDGRTRAFYIVEPGKALLNDSIQSATGTRLNDEFTKVMAQLDSVDNLDDLSVYTDFVLRSYEAHRNDPIGSYLAVEFIKYAELPRITSLLADAPEEFSNAPKTQHYLEAARLRDATSAGKPYTDIEGETASGKPLLLSSLVNRDGYTLVDFWASWCPYCIKELPDLARLQAKWPALKIVGVAVRDLPADTKAAVKKHNISWPVLYNTQRRPYDIYGFSGIPHHMLISPDGTIVSRGESAAQIDQRLTAIFEPDVAASTEP